MNKLFTFFNLLIFLWFCSLQLNAQTVISEVHLKNFSIETEIYPYDWGDLEGKLYGLRYDPSIKLSESEFAYLWKPKFKGYKQRTLTCYNLLLEEVWEQQIPLEDEGEVVNLFKSEEEVVVLTYDYNGRTNWHHIYAHRIRISDGEKISHAAIYSVEGNQNMVLGYDFSPDGNHFALYHYFEDDPRISTRSAWDYLNADQTFGYRVTNVDELRFTVFDKTLTEIDEGKMGLNIRAKEKIFALDCQLDNAGNVYVAAFQKPATLQVTQYNAASEVSVTLSYEGFPEPWFKHAPYMAHLPPAVGDHEQIFAAHAVREKVKGKWRTQEFRLITFDFKTQEASLSNQLPIGSAFRVQLAKVREDAGLRPSVNFDRFTIKDVIPMPDSSVWVLTQRFEEGRFYVTDDKLIADPAYNSRSEEIIMYEFTPDGKARKAIIIPLIQFANTLREMVSRSYNLKIDREKGELMLITREGGRKEYNRIPKIFYRKIDLNEGTYQERTPIYEGNTKHQFLIPAYTVWLNENVAAMMVMDGETDRFPQLVSVKIGPLAVSH